MAGIKKKLITFFTTPIIKLLGKIHIFKKPEETIEKLDKSIDNFRDQFLWMKSEKKMVLKMFITAVIQSFAYYSITYMVYRAFGNTGITFWQIIPTQAFLLLIMTFIPTPGSGLGAEGGFLLLFNSIFEQGTIHMSILFWRIYTFYLPIIIGALFLIPARRRKGKQERGQRNRKRGEKMKTLIVTGGNINLEQLREYGEEYKEQNIIAVDKGLEKLSKLNIIPTHVVGDFDSISKEILEQYQDNKQIIFHKYNPEKDNTDTDIAVKLAIGLKSENITILGALGKRMDHSLANIHILKYALDAKIPCQIMDTNNKIYLIKDSYTLYQNEVYGNYISLIPLTSRVEGITLKGFKYPLTNYSMPIGLSLGISNEIIEKTATIEIKKGVLIVIESKD